MFLPKFFFFFFSIGNIKLRTVKYSLESETFETRRIESFVKNIFESNIYSQVHRYRRIFYLLYTLNGYYLRNSIVD